MTRFRPAPRDAGARQRQDDWRRRDDLWRVNLELGKLQARHVASAIEETYGRYGWRRSTRRIAAEVGELQRARWSAPTLRLVAPGTRIATIDPGAKTPPRGGRLREMRRQRDEAFERFEVIYRVAINLRAGMSENAALTAAAVDAGVVATSLLGAIKKARRYWQSRLRGGAR